MEFDRTIGLDGGQASAEPSVAGLLYQDGFIRVGMTSSSRLSSSSIVPNCPINFVAVFSPTPFTPGMLSTGVAHETHDLRDARRLHSEAVPAFLLADPFILDRIIDASRGV